MLAKLALRNVRRQIGNYLIYFITVSLTVAMIFAVNNLIYSDQLQYMANQFNDFAVALTGFSLFISAIVAFVLSYASSFMLKLRKREFGTYLTLGMTRGNLLTIFTLETLILGCAALCVGTVLGLFLYQGLMLVVSTLLELPLVFASYSLSGLGLTVLLVAGVFVLASLTSALYLRRVSIYDLIHGARRVEKSVRFPFIWLLCALLSLFGIAACCVRFYRLIEQSITGTQESTMQMFGILALLSVLLILFHVGFARSGVFILLKNAEFCVRGTNTFVLRQLSGRLRANSVMLGVVAFLTVFAAMATNMAFTQKISETASLERRHPYDISYSAYLSEEQSGRISLEEGRRMIDAQAGIAREIFYDTYISENGYLHSFTPWNGEGYQGLYDSFITASDFNRLYAPLGYEALNLRDSFVVLTDTPQLRSANFSAAELSLGGKAYRHEKTLTGFPIPGYRYFLAVVPDEAAAALTPETQSAVFDVKDKSYDAQKLFEALSYTETEDYGDASYNYERCDFLMKEYSRLQRNQSSAIFLVGALYIGLVFVLLAMAILALKTLTGMSEDRERYQLLSRLGTDKLLLQKTLLRQTGAFFFMPFIAPLALSVPTAMVCVRIAELLGFGEVTGQIVLITVISALIFAAIYLLYFAATYLIAKRNLLK